MNIKEIAQLAGVSTATVSRVLNHSPKVSLKLQNKVNGIILETGFIPNLVGRNLRQSCSMKILFTMPYVHSPFYSNVLYGCEERAAQLGYDTLTVSTHESVDVERRVLDLLTSKQVDGAIMCTPSLKMAELASIASTYPIVFACIGIIEQPVIISNVSIDARLALYDSVTHCLSRGRRRIALMRGPYDTTIDIAGELGYRDALKQFGIEVNDELNIRGVSGGYLSGENMCERIMTISSPPDAIVTISDQLAIGCVRQLLSMGLKPGEDVDVIGFHDSPITEVFIPSISTISQPMQQIGATAFDLLHDKITEIDSSSKTVILPHKLVLRQTTR